MTNNYLGAHELATLVGCLPGSKACMRRWLDRNGWPYECNRVGFPLVSRAYHDARLAGASVDVTQAEQRVEPNFAALLA
ncbi:DUF4224 domain-containing protein [Herbaspirillum aquaticum]|nr:DUF4224 domain-containing protein [Herbaspirillum aquaticum]